MALIVCLVIRTLHAQQREYIAYSGQSYSDDQLGVAAVSPMMAEPAQHLDNGDHSIPRIVNGHHCIIGTVNGFFVVFMAGTEACFTALSVKLARNAGIRVGRVTSSNTATGREHGGIAAADTMTVSPFVAKGVAIVVPGRFSVPLLGMDMLNRFQVAYSGGFMILRGGR